MTDRLVLPRRYRDQLEALLSKHVPGVEVWAYGSRVNGRSHDGSDLDLVLRGPALEPLDGRFYDLLEAIEKSDIPILVQAHDWAMLPEIFHREIERDHVVVQEGMGTHTKAREWREVTLAEAPIAIIDGDRGKNYPKQHEFLESGHCLFLNAGNVTSDGFNFSSCAFVSSDRDQRLRKGKLNRHDVVLTTRGTVGNSAYFDATISYEHVRINSGMVILRALQPALHPRYLYVLTQSQLFLSQVQALRTGSAQPQLPIRDIERITIPLPPLPEQRAIAHVLGTLDDKIALNRRMSETLEAMARALFKSWFVAFEPVRAKMEGRWRRGESIPGLPADLYDLFPDRWVDSELGEIPEGWGKGVLDDVIELLSGGTPKTSMPDYWGGDIPWYTAKDAPNGSDVFAMDTERMITQLGVEKSATRILDARTTVITARGTVGRLACLGIPMAMNQTCYGIRGAHGYPDFFTYWNVRTAVDELQMRTHGTIFDTITRQTFALVEMALAPIDLTLAFEAIVEPIMALILNNLKESRALETQRDALLPRLVSGEIMVDGR